MDDDEYFQTIDTPLSTNDATLTPSMGSLTLGAPTGVTPVTANSSNESRGGIPFGRTIKVAYDVNACLSANDMKAAFKNANSIPLSRKNGLITNFQVLSGDASMATNANIPKILVGVKIEQKTTVGAISKPLLLELSTCPALASEKFGGAHSGDLDNPAAAPLRDALVMTIADGSNVDRLNALPVATLGYAHEHGAPAAMRKTYIQSPSNPADVIINVSTIQPYVADYNNHADVLAGHYDAITTEDIKYACSRNNGDISRKGAFQLIDTLASNAESLAKQVVPFATENDLSKAAMRVVIGSISQFDRTIGEMALKTLSFDTLHLGLREGATLSKAVVDKGNDREISTSFRVIADFLAFPRPE